MPCYDSVIEQARRFVLDAIIHRERASVNKYVTNVNNNIRNNSVNLR
jgi:hypothetical protein